MMMLAALWGLGCASAPTESLTWREQWELFVLTEDGSLIEGRVATGNTGLYRGQGHFTASRWMPGTTAIVFAMDGGPADVDVSDAHESVRVGSALLGRYEEGPHWTLRLAHEEANAIVHVDPGGPPVDLATSLVDGKQWTVAVPIANGDAHGWFTAGRRGGKFEGRALAVHRGGDGAIREPRTLVTALGNGISIGLDRQGTNRAGWARIGDRDIPTDRVVHATGARGESILDFRPQTDLVVTVTPGTIGGNFDGHAELLAGERLVAGAWGHRGDRRIRRGKAEVAFEGEDLVASGLVLEVR
ncbi:MAG: hypothetical protein VX127_11165 [Myxococcota bacterium]|nr:hypothetical protein [Myxococcota bacterium]